MITENKRIFITGYKGMIGSRLVKEGCSPFLSDVTDIVAIDKEIHKSQPELIIHLGSKSDVNFCELAENKRLVNEVNVKGSVNVFSMADKHKVPVIFVSSDHIFSGNFLGNYKESSTDFVPKNYYGLIKFGVEAASMAFENVKIVRTSTLFYKTRPMIAHYLDALSKGEKVYPPFFLRRSFMHMNHFVDSLLEYSNRIDTMPNILNISGNKTISWYKFIRDYAIAWDYDSSLVYPRFQNDTPFADRPLRGGLNTKLSKDLGITQYSYLDGIVSSEAKNA